MTIQVDIVEKKRGRPRKKEAKEKITMLMHPLLRDRLRAMAEKDNLGYQSLAHQILADSVAKRVTYEEGGSKQRLALLAHDLFSLLEKAEEELKGSEGNKEWEEAHLSLCQAAKALSALYQLDED